MNSNSPLMSLLSHVFRIFAAFSHIRLQQQNVHTWARSPSCTLLSLQQIFGVKMWNKFTSGNQMQRLPRPRLQVTVSWSWLHEEGARGEMWHRLTLMTRAIGRHLGSLCNPYTEQQMVRVCWRPEAGVGKMFPPCVRHWWSTAEAAAGGQTARCVICWSDWRQLSALRWAAAVRLPGRCRESLRRGK